MRKTIVLSIIGLVMLAGCSVLPMGVESCLYTANSVLKVTVQEVESGTPFWAVDPNATPAEKVVVLQRQKAMLIATIKQVQANTEQVVTYISTKEGVVPGSK